MIALPGFSAWSTVPLHLVRGEMNITQNMSESMSIPAGLNIDVPNTIDFRKINNFLPNPRQHGGFIVSDSCLIIPEDGFYEASGYANIKHPVNNSSIAVVFIINDNTFSPRSLKSFANDGGVFRLTAGEGSAWFPKGTKLGIAVASDHATNNLIISDSTIKAMLVSRR